jgi:hypothetical protein
VVLALGLILVGPTLAEWLAAHTRMGAAFEWTWKILQWPLVLALVATALTRRVELLRPRCGAGLDLGQSGRGAGHGALGGR